MERICALRSINLQGLLRTKQTRRDMDIADRIVLERAREIIRERQSLVNQLLLSAARAGWPA